MARETESREEETKLHARAPGGCLSALSLLRLAHVSNLFSSFLVWGPFSSEDSPRACAFVSFVWCISTGWRQSSPRTRSHGANYKYRGRHSAADHWDLFSWLPPLSLFLGFPFLRSVALDSGYILCFSWVLVQVAVSCVKEKELLLSLWTVHSFVE